MQGDVALVGFTVADVRRELGGRDLACDLAVWRQASVVLALVGSRLDAGLLTLLGAGGGTAPRARRAGRCAAPKPDAPLRRQQLALRADRAIVRRFEVLPDRAAPQRQPVLGSRRSVKRGPIMPEPVSTIAIIEVARRFWAPSSAAPRRCRRATPV